MKSMLYYVFLKLQDEELNLVRPDFFPHQNYKKLINDFLKRYAGSNASSNGTTNRS